MDFEFPEDEKFFRKLLCKDKNVFNSYLCLFDFREPKIKRSEFCRIRNKVLKDLIDKYGQRCMLQYPNRCINSKFVVDHLIPLSSNKLNKILRGILAEKGKKIKTQSFGSNHINNLIIACSECNSFKKHKFLNRKDIVNILELKVIANNADDISDTFGKLKRNISGQQFKDKARDGW
ncbi:hypothetical protein HYX03_04200 [Candidatus Woesearchaeota archaeon]|nr:hypothetical protein [Candidatus Woesearchaeota archaeon]